MRTFSPKNRAFSLLELIAVILIIGIIAAFVIPAMPTILRGTQMTQAEQILTDQVKLARQFAVTRNHSVQVRFIRYADPEAPGEQGADITTGYYRAIPLVEILDNGAAVPIDKPQLLPTSIVINAGNFSTLISNSDMQPPKHASKARSGDDGGDPGLPRGIDWNYDYVSFRFLPDGSTNLNSTSGVVWCVTLHNINDKPTGNTPPPNFVTLQVDPVSGAVRIYRPTV